MKRGTGWIGVVAAGLGAWSALGFDEHDYPKPVGAQYVIDRGPMPMNELGVDVVHKVTTIWRPMCGTPEGLLTEADLKRIAEENEAAFGPGKEVTIIDTPRAGFGARQGAFNIVFAIGAGGPAGSNASFAAAEAYLESKYSDPITIQINVSWSNLGSGVIGATGSNFVNGIAYSTVRTGLVNRMDANDTIQSWLPTGSTAPFRFTAASSTVTDQATLKTTFANYRSMGFTNGSGAVASMTYNSAFSFDFDPSNGVSANLLSLVDTVVHETTHAMGFVSAGDSGGEPTVLDLFRFQRVSGSYPTTVQQFQTLARLVAAGSDCVSSVGTSMWRMSPGGSGNYQASHFFEQAPSIGIMDPAEANGETNYPNYYKTSDATMVDAIGWDDTLPCAPSVTADPQPRSVLAGQNATFNVTASGSNLTYQWRKGTTNLPSNSRYQGSTTATLTIVGVTTTDAGNYNVVVTNTCGSTPSGNALLSVSMPCPADVDDGTGTGVPDGGVDIADLSMMLQWFEAGDLRADKDDGSRTGMVDGAVDINDLIYFLLRFEAGC